MNADSEFVLEEFLISAHPQKAVTNDGHLVVFPIQKLDKKTIYGWKLTMFFIDNSMLIRS